MKKATIIENMEFANRNMAAQYCSQADARIKRLRIGLIIAAAATLSAVLMLALMGSSEYAGLFALPAMTGAIASYIVGGGFPIAFRAAKKIATFGWFVAPFPYDIPIFIVTFMLAIMAFFFIPVIFVFINYVQEKRNLTAAAQYVSACAAANAAF